MAKTPKKLDPAADATEAAFHAIRQLAELAALGLDDALTGLAEVADEVDTQTRIAVADHREHTGASWARIGRALGVTRSAVQQRFSAVTTA